MFIVQNINDINCHNIYFSESIKNTVLLNAKFYRILYSTSLYILNTIILNIKLYNVTIEQSFNKYKCSYPIEKNISYIRQLEHLERRILDMIDTKKNRIYNITTQLNSGMIKLFTNTNEIKSKLEVVLKISGIWETEREIGITYKFMLVNELV